MCHCLSALYDLTTGEKAACRAPLAEYEATGELRTYKMANLRGLSRKTGVNIRPIQVANIAKAAMSSPPNTSNRSHRLTAGMG